MLQWPFSFFGEIASRDDIFEVNFGLKKQSRELRGGEEDKTMTVNRFSAKMTCNKCSTPAIGSMLGGKCSKCHNILLNCALT